MLLWAMMKPLEAESQKCSHGQSLLSSHTVVSEFKPQGWGYESSSGGWGRRGGGSYTFKRKGGGTVSERVRRGKKVEGAGPREPEDCRSRSWDFLQSFPVKNNKWQPLCWGGVGGWEGFERVRWAQDQRSSGLYAGWLHHTRSLTAASSKPQLRIPLVHRAHAETSPVSCVRYTTSQTQMDHTHVWQRYDTYRSYCQPCTSTSSCVLRFGVQSLSFTSAKSHSFSGLLHLGLEKKESKERSKLHTCTGRHTYTHTQATNHWALLERSKWGSFYFALFAGNNRGGRRVAAKFKWVTQIC